VVGDPQGGPHLPPCRWRATPTASTRPWSAAGSSCAMTPTTCPASTSTSTAGPPAWPPRS
jgi:hypothetical protein